MLKYFGLATAAFLFAIPAQADQRRGGAITIASVRVAGQSLTSGDATLAIYPDFEDPIAALAMNTCGEIQYPTVTAGSRLDVGKAVHVYSDGGTEFMLQKSSGADFHYNSFNRMASLPIDMDTYYSVEFYDDGWVPAQTWQHALYVPTTFDMNPSFDVTVMLPKTGNFTLQWSATEANDMWLQFPQNSIACHMNAKAGSFDIPEATIAKLGSAGIITVYTRSTAEHALAGRTVTLSGTAAVSGHYEVSAEVK